MWTPLTPCWNPRNLKESLGPVRLHHEYPWCVSLVKLNGSTASINIYLYISHIWNAFLPSWNLQHFGLALNIPSRAFRCEVKLVSRAFGGWGRRCCFALDTEEDLCAVRDPRIRRFARQPDWIERRRDGGLTDTSNFLMQPFCNSRGKRVLTFLSDEPTWSYFCI